MPIRYRVDGKRNLVVAAITGDINRREIPMFLRQTQRDRVAKALLVLLKDGKAKSPDYFENAKSAIELCGPDANEYRTAIVADSDRAFGLMRLYHSYRFGAVVRSRVFRDIKYAFQWIGLRNEFEIAADATASVDWDYVIDDSPSDPDQLNPVGMQRGYLRPFSRAG